MTCLGAALAVACLSAAFAGEPSSGGDDAALAGDPDYGAYLMQECASCHLAEGSGIVPPIDGIEPDYLRLAMAEYASGERENAAMGSVARSLGLEEMAALVAYVETQESTED